MRETLWVPVVAVLGPLIGSAVGVLLPSRESLLHRLLAFAAGTMLTLSFLELIPESLSACSPPACAAGLAIGVFGVLALHHLLPPNICMAYMFFYAVAGCKNINKDIPVD